MPQLSDVQHKQLIDFLRHVLGMHSPDGKAMLRQLLAKQDRVLDDAAWRMEDQAALAELLASHLLDEQNLDSLKELLTEVSEHVSQPEYADYTQLLESLRQDSRGDIAPSDKGKISGDKAVVAESIHGDVLTGEYARSIQTKTYIERQEIRVAQGDYIGGDKHIHGDTIGGDKIVIYQDSSAQSAAVLETTVPQPPEPTRPPHIPNFVGRNQELIYFAKKLEEHNLAVISGMAGVGKTALAAMLTQWLADDTDNIFWHTFHEGEDIDAVIRHLAGFLAWHGIGDLWQMLELTRITGGKSPSTSEQVDYLLQLLRNHNYLLCFDDFHEVEHDPSFEQLFNKLGIALTSKTISIIVTTRRIPSFLRITPVEPLQGLTEVDAYRLLNTIKVALSDKQKQNLYNITSGNAEFLILAIDALNQGKDPDEFIRQLASTEDVQRYLVQEVNDILDGDERSIMGAVAILLTYGGTRKAIEASLNGRNVFSTLRRLQDRYLLLVQKQGSEDIYSQHSIVREFYYEYVSEHQRHQMHRRVADFYKTEKKEKDIFKAILHFERADEYGHVVDLAAVHTIELMNLGRTQQLLQVLEHFSENELNPEQWIAVNISKGELYARARELQQAPKCFRRALRQIERLPYSLFTNEMKARVCRDMGTLLQHENPEEALKWFESGLEALDSVPESQQIPALYIYIGSVQGLMGNYEEAQQAILKGVRSLPPGPSLLLVDAMLNLGGNHQDRGEIKEAYQHTQQALELAQQLNASFHIASIRDNLATLLYHQGNWEASIAEGHRALALAERLGSISARARFSLNLGCTYISRGDDDKALEHLQTGLEMARTYGLKEVEIGAQASLAELYLRRGEPDLAVPLLQEAERLAQEMKLSSQLPEIYRNWALVHLSKEDTQAALDAVQQSLEIARQLEAKLEVGMSLRTLGDVRLTMSAPFNKLLLLYEESVSNLAENDYEAARTEVHWGQILLEDPDPSQGKVLLQKAYLLFDKLGAKRDRAELVERYPSEWFKV